MKDIFIKLNDSINKKLIVKGSTGVVLIEGPGILFENNIESSNTQIDVNTNITVEYLDLYSERVILNCSKNKKTYKASVSYDFILNNCVIENKDKNKAIDAVYAVNSINNVISGVTLLNALIFITIFICGILVGKI